MLAGNLVGSVERQVHPEIFAAAADTHFVLGDEIGLRAGIVLIADLAEDFIGLAARAFAVAGHAGGGYGGFALNQSRLGSAVPRLCDVV